MILTVRMVRTSDKGEVDGSNPSGPTEYSPWSEPVWTLKMPLAQCFVFRNPNEIRTRHAGIPPLMGWHPSPFGQTEHSTRRPVHLPFGEFVAIQVVGGSDIRVPHGGASAGSSSVSNRDQVVDRRLRNTNESTNLDDVDSLLRDQVTYM